MGDVKISELGAIVSISDSNVIPMVNMSNPATTGKVTASQLKEYAISEVEQHLAVKVVLSSVNSLPQTVSTGAAALVTADMECVHSVLSNPLAQTSDWTVATGNGSVTVSGSIDGTTDITLYLEKPKTV